MNILVTGSSGFVGKRLVQELEQKGYTVTGFDAAEGKDLLNKKQVREAVKGKDVVFHTAAVLDETAGNVMEVNVQGTQNVVEACIAERVNRLVHLSTVGVAGDFEGKQDENAPYNPKTAYESSKAEAEKKVLDSQEELAVSVVRAPVVYGAGSYWLKVIGYVKKNYPLIGNGNNKWQMIYVNDLVNALVVVMEKDNSSGEIFLPAEEKAHTLKEVYTKIRKKLEMRGDPSSVPKWIAIIISYPLLLTKLIGKKPLISPGMVERAVRNREYNTEKIRKLGWKPIFSLDKGIKETFKELEGV